MQLEVKKEKKKKLGIQNIPLCTNNKAKNIFQKFKLFSGCLV